MEKVITRARHIEVQIFGDGRNFVHCFERECSLQRRRQKVWEEAQASMLPDDIRQRLCASAVALDTRTEAQTANGRSLAWAEARTRGVELDQWP